MTTAVALEAMKSRNISVLSHGATGRGNDQVRFQLACNMLAPEFSVYAPWRDPEFLARFQGRLEMIEYCEKKGLPITANRESPYSTDANMLGLTHEGGKLESLGTAADFIKPGMGVLSEDAPAKPEYLTITFKSGVPIAINQEKLALVKFFQSANHLAGAQAIGIAEHVVENRYVGVKSRGVYEAPGMELLGSAYDYMLQLILDKRARDFFNQNSQFISRQVYQGYWYDLGTSAALAAVQEFAKLVSGDITLKLYKGRLSFVKAANVTHSIYSEDDASMEAVGSYNHQDSEGFLRVLGVSARSLAKKGQIRLE